MPNKGKKKNGATGKQMPVVLDPLREEDARRFVELFRDERSYTLQQERMHEGVGTIKDRYDAQAKSVKPKISRLVNFARELPQGVGRSVVELFQAMADILEQFTLNTVSFAMEAVDYMAEYIECKTENYHRLLVVLSQEVQDHLDAYKAVQATNSFNCRELHARVSSLEDQVLEVKAELLTFKLREMRDSLQSRQDGTFGLRTASHASGRSTPSQAPSLASSYQDSIYRQNLARKRKDVPGMILEAQRQAQLYRQGPSVGQGPSLDGYD